LSGVSAGFTRGQLHVVVLSRALPFPHGYAVTNRVRLLGRALVEQGAAVTVLSTAVTERPPVVENRAPKGSSEGVAFEYTTGTTVRSDRFVVRRIVEARGLIVGAWRVARLRRRGRVDCIYLWWTSQEWTPTRVLVIAGLRALGIPVVIEMNEPPWPLWEGRRGQGRGSPLLHVRGVVAISRFLRDWALAEAQRRGLDPEVIEVPILVDVGEQDPGEYPRGEPVLVYAASPGYNQALDFLSKAMTVVWRRHPGCRLVVTGVNPGDPASRPFMERVAAGDFGPNVEVPGHLSRERLLAEYGRAHAVLIPLFDDMRSRARFPTKIGEYLASGRPMVSTRVGEVERYFVDGVTAFVAPPGDAQAFGEKVCEALDDPQRAARVGEAGRSLAKRAFHYQRHAEPLMQFFAAMSGKRSPTRPAAGAPGDPFDAQA
jgi:glycosyltransferase involved in cell wall biosynthesis